ncbi:hypothetical protein DB30_01549 [Enhygromyxa salina]|uniref:Uncharacterized protein n=1 Tax=Enhygromyxa salina TaxID=215803 RepID=A0A0C1ZMS0_9BACT|nr:hypothetical protein [Enhygromyxa salina]KIG12358.1 hypothetical protein DB30_01549 [Enhygromyxa salina]
MPQHILEGSKVKVRARVCDGKASTTNVTFVFFNDATEFERIPAQLPSVETLGDQGWVEAEVTAPDVDPTKKQYQLTYKVELAERTISDLPPFTVWPATGKLLVTPATAEHENMKGFRFRIKQNEAQQGDEKRVTEEAGTYEFDLIAGHAFTLEALPPYEITEWVKQDGHEVECKATMKFEADFFAPQAGTAKQYVNIAPADLTAATLGQDGIGTAVIVKMGVKGDPDRANVDKYGKEGLIIHFRATFGPKVGNGGIEKSTRNDPSYKTEVKKELDVDEVTGPDADKVYKGKLKMKADGTAELKLYLGLAGGDICKLEIAGSDTFLNDATIAADATLTFTNWRKSYYELLAADFYDTRELEDVDVGGVIHHDFPSAALTKLKALGDSVFIEYTWMQTHTFAPAAAPSGTILSKRFLEITNSEDSAYMLTDYTMRRLPTGVAWQGTHANLTNYIKLCDANYYWEHRGGAFPQTRTRFRVDTTTVKKELTVRATASGYFIPVSGLSASSGGTGSGSLWTPAGAVGIAWKAKINPDTYKTVIDPIAEDRPPGVDGANTRTLTITESNQNPAACSVTFTKPTIGHISTSVSATDKAAIEAWVQARFVPAQLKAHNNKVSVKVTGEAGNARRNSRVTAVKAIIQAKLDALAGTHRIAVHPGLDDAGVAREGTLTMNAVDMATSTRRSCIIELPAAAPTDPGSFVGAASATKCPITLDTYVEAHNEALGLCEGADVLAVFKKSQGAVDVCVTMHELGHSYGQAVYNGTDSPPVGMAVPKMFSEPESEARYKTNGSKGQVYTGHQHSGSHCAYGLSDAQKAQASYQVAGMGAAAACVMFGSGGVNRNFCPQCIDLIRGANLTAIPNVKGS